MWALAGAGFYYWVYKPDQKRLERQRQEAVVVLDSSKDRYGKRARNVRRELQKRDE